MIMSYYVRRTKEKLLRNNFIFLVVKKVWSIPRAIEILKPYKRFYLIAEWRTYWLCHRETMFQVILHPSLMLIYSKSFVWNVI